VCGRSAPAGVAPDELKLDLGSSSPPPAADRSRSAAVPSPSPSHSTLTQTTSDDDNDDDQQPQPDNTGPLRAHVAAMAKRFVEDGRAIRRCVLEHLHRFCRLHFTAITRHPYTRLIISPEHVVKCENANRSQIIDISYHHYRFLCEYYIGVNFTL